MYTLHPSTKVLHHTSSVAKYSLILLIDLGTDLSDVILIAVLPSEEQYAGQLWIALVLMNQRMKQSL